MDKDAMLGYLVGVIKPMQGHDRDIVRSKIKELKQTDGEGWAIGETMERIMILFGNMTEEESKEFWGWELK